jgi:hypothetical protein
MLTEGCSCNHLHTGQERHTHGNNISAEFNEVGY